MAQQRKGTKAQWLNGNKRFGSPPGVVRGGLETGNSQFVLHNVFTFQLNRPVESTLQYLQIRHFQLFVVIWIQFKSRTN
jgi:hypothetical protein